MFKRNTVSSRPWLLLPVEIKARELTSRVLLSCVAAERGYGVLLGRNGFNINGMYPRGVYLDKCLSPYKINQLEEQVNNLGNKIASLDVEGLVYQSKEKWLRIRTSQETVDLSSLIFSWGEKQGRMINEAYDVLEKLVVTGSPSVDLWQPRMDFLYQKEVAAIKRRYGNFILLPSNFAVVINANGKDFVVNQYIKNGLVRTKSEIQTLKDSFAYQEKIFSKFIELIPKLAKEFPDLNVVLRPHPGDDNKVWHNLAKKWPDNIYVVYEGGITPWIIASKVVVHNNCSTAVEAFAMEKPVIAYVPVTHDKYDQNIPNSLSGKAATVSDVLKLIRETVFFQYVSEEIISSKSEKFSLYCQHINSSKEELACERIVNALNVLELPLLEAKFDRLNVAMQLKIMLRKLKRRFKDLTRQNELSYAYRKQKNPGITISEVEQLLNLFKINLNRFRSVKVEQIEEDAFCFYNEP